MQKYLLGWEYFHPFCHHEVTSRPSRLSLAGSPAQSPQGRMTKRGPNHRPPLSDIETTTPHDPSIHKCGHWVSQPARRQPS